MTRRAPSSGIMGRVTRAARLPRPAVPRRTATAVGLALAVGLLAACGGEDATEPATAGPTTAPATTEPTTTAEPTTEPPTTPEPEPTPDDGRPTAAPEQRVEAGTVAEGSAASAEGSGSAEVGFVRDGEFATVIHLDCTACTGTAVLTAPDRGSPWGVDLAGLEVAYLLDVHEGSDPEQSLWLAAEGDWAMRFESWNDLEYLTGEQSGTGAAVLFLVDTAPAVHVRFEPADDEDRFSGRYFGITQEAARMFGDTEAMDEKMDLELPGVLAINTRGSWTITPLP